ncbi:MAG: helix-turn-helix domain-containing protein [Sulfolobales archaeon]
MKFYKVVIPLCPTMSEILRDHDHVGFRLSRNEMIHILMGRAGEKQNRGDNTQAINIYRAHGIRLRRYRRGGYTILRSRGCVLRDILTNFYVNSIRVTREGVVAIVAVPESEINGFLRSISGRCKASVEELPMSPVLTEEENMLLKMARGLYESPRRISLSELSEKLGIPKSNLSYRLRKAIKKILILIPSS